MNSLVVTIAALVWFVLGYIYYGRFIEKKLVEPDDSRRTPAYELEDGVDYHPSKTHMLWGNHFASIAGAGPIIGPILAVSIFGWGYTLLWVAIGAVFMGAVHDYLTMMISVRNKGRGIYDLAEPMLGQVGKGLVSALVFMMLTLVVTVFMVSVADAFVSRPELVIPTFGLVVIAMVMGYSVTRLGLNETFVMALGIIAAYALLWVGNALPVALPESWGKEAVLIFWCTCLTLYCLLASISPIWLILQPRDFISSVKLFVGMGLGFLSIMVMHPTINAPFHRGEFFSGDKPIWPILFIIVACGAISGFHSLVSTGTSSRQLERESSGKPVAFGGMLVEGALAVMVIMVVGAGLKWGTAPEGTPAAAAGMWFGSALKEGWIVAFGNGFGKLVSGMNIPYLTLPIAGLLGAVMVKSFILTTLDSGTRLGRFLVAETLGEKIPLLKKNRLAATLVMLVPGYLLAVTNSWESVWKLFGASNQLIAAIALTTVTAYLSSQKKPRLYTLIPALFMLLTSAAALGWEAFAPKSGYLTGPEPSYDLGIISIVLLLLAALTVLRAVKAISVSHKEVPPVPEHSGHPGFR
ncbi:carbon starvation protein A [Desulfovibrio sp. JC010]|uniref:carbon starvation CstA family protein n=1 Tax=Desulfovibrio sp. JC010 TaxID=2593641 RepID=UPI0013D62344|nr:carbon starvation protein A [Desulfovibrio sp. JC010]NDV25129.1 carbon starvation protein A [Desulfovibrio sp. JC010]